MSEFKCERCGENYNTTDDHAYRYICMDCQAKREEALDELGDKLAFNVLSVDDVIEQLNLGHDELLEYYRRAASWTCNVCNERVPMGEIVTLEEDGELYDACALCREMDG